MTATTPTHFDRPLRTQEPVGSRRIHLPRTRLVLESRHLFAEPERRSPPTWRDY
jgi:hypothetical protein